MHPLSRDFICTFLLGFTVHSATSAPECRAKADVVFLLDSSQSVGTANFDLSKSFIADVIKSFTIGVHDIQVGLVLFNGDAHLQFHLNAYNKKNDIVSAVRRIPYDGGTTATHAAIKMMREQMYLPQNGDRPNAPNIAILVTDGISNSPLETIDEAGIARSLKIVPYIMAIGIGFSTMPLELEEVANKPTAEWVAMAKEFSDLAGIKDRVAQQACKVAVKVRTTTRSTTTAAATTTTTTTAATTTTRAATTTTRAMRQTTTPTTVVSTTERPTTTVATPRTTGLRTTTSTSGTRTKQRTTAESLRKNCIAKADVVFLLDSSFSVEEEHFQLCKAFIVDIIKTFTIGRNDFQVGLIVFNDDAHIQFHLNKFTRKEDLILAVRNTAYVGGFTATHSALKLMREEAFQLKHGDRVDARNIAILVTDGVSDRSDETVREADAARKINVPHIMGIGIGLSLVLNELDKVVNKPASEWATAVTNFKDLSKVKDKIAKQTCQVALHGSLGNVVTAPTMAVATTEAVKPNTQKSITPPTPRCEAAGDLIFVLDASDSVKKHDFELAKNFIKSIVRSFSIARDKFQIGLITYGTHVRTEIPLGSEETMDATLKAINNISQTGGTTNTGGALKVLRETGFTKHGGDREGAPNIAIVMTDGVSNDKLSTKQEAEIARKNVVANIFAIGIGQSVLIQELVNIVGHPPFGRFFSSKDFNSLTGIVDQIADAACKVAVEDKLTTTTDTEVTVMPSTRRPTSFSVTTVAVEKFITSTTTEATFSQTETPSTKRPSTTVVTRKTTVTRYELVQERKNWNGARWHCINDGGRLAVINDNVTKAHIDRLLKGTTGGTWIAGFKKKQWFFSNGEEVSWYNWHLGEPNDLAGHEDVLQIFPKDDPPLYKWNDGFKGNNEIWGIPCFYICQFNDSTICGQLSREGKCIRIDNTKYYYFENDNLYRQAGYKWSDAVGRCKQRHGVLARIRTASENLIIVQEIKKRPKAIYWIDGYWRKVVPVSWTWADANSDITNSLFWSPGEPSNPQNEHCIEVMGTTGHLWNDLDCETKLNFVCQYEDISTESLTTTTPSRTIATTIAGESTAEMTAGTQAASTSSTTRESSSSAATTPPNEETATTAEPANTRNAITSSKTSHTTMHTLAKSPFTKLIMTSQTPTTRPVPTQFLKSSTSTFLTHTVTSAPTQTTKLSSVTELVDHRSSVTSQFTNSELPSKTINADFTSTVSKGQSTLPTCQPCRCTSDSVTQSQSSKDKNSVATGVAAMTTPVATGANLTTRRIFRLFRFPQRRKTHPPMTTEVVYTAPPFVRVSVNVPEIMFLTGLGVIVVLFTIWMGYVAQEKLRKRSLASKVAPSGALDRRQSVYVTELS